MFSIWAVAALTILVVGVFIWALRSSSSQTAGPEAAIVTPAHISASALGMRTELPVAGSITWPSMLDDRSGELSLDERLALAQRLGVVSGDWTTPILRRAVHEESDPRMLDALVDALIAKRLD